MSYITIVERENIYGKKDWKLVYHYPVTYKEVDAYLWWCTKPREKTVWRTADIFVNGDSIPCWGVSYDRMTCLGPWFSMPLIDREKFTPLLILRWYARNYPDAMLPDPETYPEEWKNL